MNEIDTKQAKQFFEDHYDEMVDFLRELVARPSISESGDEYEIAKMIEAKCQEYKLPIQILGSAEQVATLSTLGTAKKRLLLSCPLDTSSPGDITKWDHPPYSGIIEDGKLYGLGSADCGAGLVMMLYTAFALKEINQEEEYAVSLAFDGGEQNGSFYGMRTLLKKESNFDAALIGYARRRPSIATGARGYHRYRISTHGKPAHTGARTKKGINAIDKMVKVVEGINNMTLPDPSQDSRFSFGSKITVSAISGGEAINIVPDECSILLDIRLVPGQTKQTADNALNNLFEKLKSKDPEIKITAEYLVGEEAYAVSEDYPLTDILQKVASKHFAIDYDIMVNGPAHVGNLLHQYRIPALVLGPRGDRMHDHDEFVELDSLVPTALTYYETILRFNQD